MAKHPDIKTSLCIACGSDKLEFYPSEFTEFISSYVFGETGRKQNRTASCMVCATVFSEIRFSDEQANKLYKNYRGADYTKERLNFEPNYRSNNERYKHLEIVEQSIKEKMSPIFYVADIGSDTRTNTLFPTKPIVLCPFGSPIFKVDGQTRAVTLFQLSHVLEHVSDPFKLLFELEPNLDFLYVEVPLEKHVEENRHPNLKVHWHEHINFFSQKGMKLLFNRLKLKPINFQVIDCDIGTSFNKVMSILLKYNSVEDAGPCDINPLEGAY